MITTGNAEMDAAFAEVQRQLMDLSSECAAKAGRIAVLEERLKALLQQGVGQGRDQHDSDHRHGQVDGEKK
jgi:hypothetical protein